MSDSSSLETKTPPETAPEASVVHSERGQATTEYALVMLAAATIALLVVAWAGNTGAIGDLFDSIVDRITSMAP